MSYKNFQVSQDSTPSLESSSPVSSESSSKASRVPTDDPTTIIGLACRVPGAENPSQLWRLMDEQRDVQRKIPAERFNVDAFYHPDGTNKGTTNAKYGYFLDQDISQFDAGFFNISGNEAKAMDPQQRLLLEVVYEALEDAGITLEEINGSQTSVFCGCFTNDYNAMTTKDLESYPKYTVTGTGNSILANRISYFYNLHGASATIDTACSSSLVCFHLGNQSLRNNESDISIVVGSALHFDPNIFITMTDLGMLSVDGRSRAFDASGKGYARGEGVCAAILKRMGPAERDGDSIRAIVRGSLTNHDGRKQGITLPSSEAQEALIRKTYRNAGLNPADTRYFEAHGTGTAAGDPRETRAIGAVFAANRQEPLVVGSVKTGIGHLEGASGLASIIKATLSLEKKKIPPNMHFNTPNPEISFDEWKIRVPVETEDWNAPGGLRRASINSFGYGGMNAHVILEGYHPSEKTNSPNLPRELAEMVDGRPFLVPLTSHSEKAGQLWNKSLIGHLMEDPDVQVHDLAYSLSARRSMHRYRSFAIGKDLETTLNDLNAPQPIAAWAAKIDETPRIGFVFTGQGGQWYAMGRQLIEQSPIFRQILEKCDDVLQSLPDGPDWFIIKELLRSKDDSRLAETQFSQPICTALQLAILFLLKEWGITPSAVVGHSSGEMAAAFAAGILSFENTVVAAYYRGLYMSNGSQGADERKGAMMAVGMTESEVGAEMMDYQGRIAVAAVNSPSSITLSGDEDAILALQESLVKRKIFARRLQVAQAFHSHHMLPLAPGYQRALRDHPGFKTEAAKLRMFSSVTARVANPMTMDESYWTANMTGTVRFSDALTGILLDDTDEKNVDVLVEIGPHPALKGPSRQVLQSLDLSVPYLSSLTRGISDYEGLLATAGQLFMLGYPVDLVAVNSDHTVSDHQPVSMFTRGRKLNNLPSYAWDHTSYWSESRLIKEHRLRSDRHALLGALMPGSVKSQPRWRNYLRLSELPWLSEHVVDGKVIFPAAGYVCMAIEAIARMIPDELDVKQIALRDVAIKSALMLADDDGTEVLLDLRPLPTSAKSTSDSWFEFTIFSYDDSARCAEHCHGSIAVERGSAASIERIEKYPLYADLKKQSDRRIMPANYYQNLDNLGLRYGEHFRLLSGDIESGPGFAIAPLTFFQEQLSTEPADACILHPTFLDASFHVIFAAIESNLGRPLDSPFVPTFFRSLKVSGTLMAKDVACHQQMFHVCSNTELPSHRVATSDVRVHSEDLSMLLVDMEGLQLTSLTDDASDDLASRSLFFRTRWQPAFDFLGQSNHLSTLGGIAQFMDAFAYQHPDSRILHVTSDLQSSVEALRLLGGRHGEHRRFRSYTPYSFSPEVAPETFTALNDMWPGLIEIEEPQEERYDIVVVEEGAGPNVQKFARHDGYVISHGTEIEEEGLSPLFAAAGIGAWRKDQGEPPFSDPLTIVLASEVSRRTETIAVLIEEAYHGSVSRINLTQLAKQPVLNKNCVVLASLDQNLFGTDTTNDAEEYESVKNLLTLHESNIVWLLEGATMDCQKPEHAVIFGLARTARSENDRLRLAILDVPPAYQNDRISERILQVMDPKITEDELSERDGTIFIPRLEADDALNSKLPNGVHSQPSLQKLDQGRPLSLKIGKVGLLETLVFSDDEAVIDSDIQDDEIEIAVKASAINFRDIAASMGIIDDYRLGDECAGVVIRKGSKVQDSAFQVGDRVVAWRPGQGAHCTVVRNPASLCYKLGDMSFAHAAAIPLILTTAYYSLCDVARLQPGETVLIHSAAGGVGQMAIQIAQMVGANIIATVGSQSKRDLLKSKFSLLDNQISSSRDDSFLGDVMKWTNGRGVDVALNSLAGELLHATWRCICPFGRFIEIGKRDIHENAKIDMDPFRRNVTFASVDLITMFECNKTLGARVFQKCCELVHDGTIRPPETITEFSYADAEKGFRLLQLGKHTGKVVLVPKQDDLVPVVPPKYRNTKLFSPKKTYLLVGGLGGLGRTLAEWMVRKGARNLHFLSRSGAQRTDAKATVEWLEARGVQVSVSRGDVTDYDAVKRCIESLGEGLAGIFQAAMVLQDSPLEQMSYQQWQACVRPKVRGTYNLHQASVECRLDFFVCFSSVSSILGSKGQANYSAANSYIDALMRHRREMGLKGTTMNCGMIVGVGAVAENLQLQKLMERIGYDPVNEQELLYQIEEAVSADSSTTPLLGGIDQHQIISGVNLSQQEFYWTQKPFFRNIYSNRDFTALPSQNQAAQNLSILLRTVTDPEKRASLLMDAFIEKIAAVLAVAPDAIRPSNPLSSYGLDSIVAVEFRKWFAKSVRVNLALFDVLSSKSITALVAKAASLVSVDAPEVHANEDDTAAKINTSSDGETVQVMKQDLVGEIARMPKSETIPMSTFQSRLWFLHHLVEDKHFLNLAVVFQMKGKPVPSVIRETLIEIKKRNAILRTAYFEGDDFAEQKPVDDFEVELEYQDLSSSREPYHSLRDYATTLKELELDIENGEIMRAALTKIDDSNHALILVFHHISIDRGSSKSFLDQFTSVYDSIKAQKDVSDISTPKISYSDFTVWHNAQLQSSALESGIKFWTEKFTGASGKSKLLPFAKSARPSQSDLKRAVLRGTFGLQLFNRMKRICRRTGVTPFQFLLAAFRAFIYRYTEEKDLTILMIDGNRPHPELEDVLGFFVNMIPIRCMNDCDTGFDLLLEDVKKLSLEAMEHSKVPFDTIVDTVQVEKDPSHFPLGQVILNYQMHGKMRNFRTQDFDIDDISSEDVPTAGELSLEALEDPLAGLNLRLEYSTTLYNEEDMDCFFDNFITFMSDIVKDHRQPVSEIQMSGPKELDRLRNHYWATDFIENKWNGASVLERILENAETRPEAAAIRTSDDQVVTYKSLVDQAQRIGFALRRMGATPGHYIGVFSRPGVEAIAGMLGILLNRCGYVSMDPDFAVDRLAFMAADSNTEIILVGRGLEMIATELVQKTNKSPQLVSIAEVVSTQGKLGLLGSAAPHDPFYVIYTSGSTGKPKGVVLTQSNTQQMLSTLHSQFDFVPEDVFLHHSSICFDLSVVQIFSALTSGATICSASAAIRKDPYLLAEFMQRSSTTFTYFTPTQFSLLLEFANEPLRKCAEYRVAFFAGERLPVRIAKAFYDLHTPAVLCNTWSPSELVVQTTIHEVTYPDANCVDIPIGFPMDNCRHYVVDSNLNPLPAGFTGEICVGGAQVGMGYLNRPEANAKAFVDDPFCSTDDRARGWTKMFRTGDRGRFRVDGQLEFHGRIAGDKQIKLRGFRVDLGEVEHRIYLESTNEHKLIDVTVVARNVQSPDSGVTDDRQLIAFVVPQQQLDLAQKGTLVTVLHRKIGKHLNAYMLPNGYQFLENMPVTIGGKVDRQSLLNRELDLVHPSGASVEKGSAEGATRGSFDENILQPITKSFREVLKLSKERYIAPTDSFFDLGGQSILLLRLQSKIKRSFKVSPSLADLFKAATPAGVYGLISGGGQYSAGNANTEIAKKLSWADETTLPNQKRYSVPNGTRFHSPSDVSNILITGVDSFIGVHMLATSLALQESTTIYILGTHQVAESSGLIRYFEKYRLFDSTVTEAMLLSKVRFVPGTLVESHFGLSEDKFKELGRKIRKIYHLGGQVSLLKSYADLKRLNVSAILDVIELAAHGECLTDINLLSTWSVPHLQSWSNTKRTQSSITAAETSATHFSPPESDELGYFKSRWVAEMLMNQAAARGFSVSIYRASAVTASTSTSVQEPADDFIRRMVLSMIEVGCVPEIGLSDPQFAVDFMPVDYLTSTMCCISRSEQARLKNEPAIFHIGNKSPLLLRHLPALMGEIRQDGATGRSVPLEDWLKLASVGQNEEGRLRWAVLKDYFVNGHNMFALDQTRTQEVVGALGEERVKCPSIDADYLRKMLTGPGIEA